MHNPFHSKNTFDIETQIPQLRAIIIVKHFDM